MADHEVRNLATVARAAVGAALRREESRGAHTRDDFPETGPSSPTASSSSDRRSAGRRRDRRAGPSVSGDHERRATQPAATNRNWYPDPMGRHEYRWFDGTAWTDQVSSHGRQSVDPRRAAPATVPIRDVTPREDRQGPGQGRGRRRRRAGRRHLFTEPMLVVNQKAKLIELNNEYAISDQHGNQIGAVRQVGQSTAKKVIRVLTSYDQFMTHKLQVVDHDHQVVLQLTRPAKVMKSKVIVQDGIGHRDRPDRPGEHGRQDPLRPRRPAAPVGTINAENWRAWNWNIQDHDRHRDRPHHQDVLAGSPGPMFTQADNYVVQIHRPLEEPLRSLVVAAAVSVDTALKQDARGFN